MRFIKELKKRFKAYQNEMRERHALSFANEASKKANKRRAENFFVPARNGKR